MGELADNLGGKIAGELIKAQDWNALIDGIEAIQSSLSDSINTLQSSVDAQFATVNATLDDLGARVDGVETELDGLRTTVENLQQQFRRVTLRTERVTYAIGESVLITGQLTDLFGAPLDLADATSRPWIDFVSSWGQFRAVSGFQSRSGVGDRTISVQVNASGQAQVLLRAEHVRGFTAEAENDVAAALTTQLPANQNKSIAATLLEAATPMEANLKTAFQALSVEYDRTDTPSLRNYVDAYYALNPTQVTDRFTPSFQHGWRDYRSTVLAAAKGDNDPRTPDPNLGTCSIQVTFRDWVGPWITLDYLANLDDLVLDYQDRLGPRIDDDLLGSLGRLRKDIVDIVKDKGLIARQRDYQALGQAVAGLGGTGRPAFVGGLIQAVQNAVNIQQIVDFGQSTAIGISEPAVAFEAFSHTAIQADAKAAELTTELTGKIDQQLAGVEERVQNQVRQQQLDFQADLLRDNGPIMTVQRSLSDVTGKVNGFQEALGKKADIGLLSRFLPENQ